MAKQFLIKLVFSIVIMVAVSMNMASACSCMMSHPQTQYCQSDFVIVARVKKVFNPDEITKVYKVRIKKEFKMSEKASVVLKSGRLVTGGYSAMCGVDLSPEVTYIVTGKVIAGQARISLCGYSKPWNELTVRQRKGFRLLYRQGCNCQITNCPWWRKQCPKEGEIDECMWDTSLGDCQTNHAICMKTPTGRCAWSTDKKYRECMKQRRRIGKEGKLRNYP